MRYTDREYKFKVNSGPDIVRFVFITCLLAPFRFTGEISKKLMFLGQKNISRMLLLSLGLSLTLTVPEFIESFLNRGINLNRSINLLSAGATSAVLFVLYALSITTQFFGSIKKLENSLEKIPEDERVAEGVQGQDPSEVVEEILAAPSIREQEELRADSCVSASLTEHKEPSEDFDSSNTADVLGVDNSSPETWNVDFKEPDREQIPDFHRPIMPRGIPDFPRTTGITDSAARARDLFGIGGRVEDLNNKDYDSVLEGIYNPFGEVSEEESRQNDEIIEEHKNLELTADMFI